MFTERRVEDPADPDTKSGPECYPMHHVVVSACHNVSEEVRKAVMSGKKVSIKPDRAAPPKFFRPQGSGYFIEPAEVEDAFKELSQGTLSPHTVHTTEAEMAERERTARTNICILNAQKWIDSAIKRSILIMGKHPSLEAWASSLEEMRAVSASLSILLMDRAISDLGKWCLSQMSDNTLS